MSDKIISKQNAQHYLWGENCDGWHLVKSATLSVIHERMPPGSEEVRHFHHKSEQFFFVLSGIASLEVDGIVYQLAANQGMHVPAKSPHQMRNLTASDIEFTVTSTPPSQGDRELVKTIKG